GGGLRPLGRGRPSRCLCTTPLVPTRRRRPEAPPRSLVRRDRGGAGDERGGGANALLPRPSLGPSRPREGGHRAMTLSDPEVLIELRDEPELLAIADALADVLVAGPATRSRSRRWVPFSLAACLAAAAAVLALLFVGGSVRH